MSCSSHECGSLCCLSCVSHSQRWKHWQHLDLGGGKVIHCTSCRDCAYTGVFFPRETAGLMIVIFWLLLLLLFQRLDMNVVYKL